MHKMKRCCIAICLLVVLFVVLWEMFKGEPVKKDDKKKDYGVFLSLDSSHINKISEYNTVVVDAQFFSKKDILQLKSQGCTVYSYINIGSIEDFREYYDEYSDLALGDYENWDEEQWIDVSSAEWQKFLVSLEEELLNKKIDGFFVDNCDVYYQYPTDDIFEGITTILEHLMTYKKPVIINGGDTYVTKFQDINGSPLRVMTGVNQESVWSKINFETEKFSPQSEDDRKYFMDYIEKCSEWGLDVYLIEYTTNNSLVQKINKYCSEKKFHYYISDSVELD